jgi:hypothetical protein
MERKQVQLTRKQAVAVRREATRRKISGSAIVREAVVGRFASGQKDVSRNHDRELADAFRK